jgi:hypothetical protein
MSVETVQQVVEQALTDDDAVECSWCGMSSNDVGVARVVEHALFDHATRAALDIVRHAELLSGYEMALAAGLPALTGHEELWREEQKQASCATRETG